jgi:negative regulator of replication initiation
MLLGMGKTVEIPDELHALLEEQARPTGLSVSAYLAHVLALKVQTRTPPEVLDRIRSRPRVNLGIDAADLINEGREERTQQLIEPWLSSTRQR